MTTKWCHVLSCHVARYFSEMPFPILELCVMVAILNLSSESVHCTLVQIPSKFRDSS